ncbi:uncharacterized protein LOC142632579 [Castanea sativa]|uniref:uncharacterized protein LOC142632579 n=1 Tax=Castanea sativa TaxID=21020 RepID=UPI003F652433
MVRKIQVCADGEEDILIWPLTVDGEYRVRSAYRMLVDNENQALPSSSTPNGVGSVWKKIWKVQVPHKIKHFLWHAAKDSLPTKQNLVARHIPIGNVCNGCGDHSESVMHALWLCDKVRSVWMTDSGFLFLVQAKCRSFLELLESEPVRRPLVRWSPSLHDHYKVNFDTIFFEETRSVGVGVVVCDYAGQIIRALRQNIGSVQSVEMAQAIVARRAVMFATELYVFRVIIEGDCSRVIAALKGFGRCCTLFGHIFDESKREEH